MTTTLYTRLDHLPGQRRELIRLRGGDVVRFLQGTLTCDVEHLDPDEAKPAAVLTVKGKLISEVVVLAGDHGCVDLLVPEDRADELAQLLDQHIIMDDVTLERTGPVATVVAWTPATASPAELSGRDVRIFRCRHPAPGHLVLGIGESVAAALEQGREVDAEVYAEHRIDTETPAWGAELVPGYFPPEVGFTYAVDYDKGCYLGQEPLARLHARGQTQRVMVRVEADARPSAPVDLVQADGNTVGRWTTMSGRERVRGLAIVRRSVAEPGQSLSTGDDARIEVRVVSGPLGDDPGVQRTAAAKVQLGRRRT